MEFDFDYSSTLSTSELGAPEMAKPLPCWCRTGDYVPLEENPLLQWVKRQRELEPERFSRQASSGVGRGRPLLTFSSSSSDSSDDDMGYVRAYWRHQRGLVEPSLHISEQPLASATLGVQLSGRRPARVVELSSSSSPSSGLERRMPSDSIPETDLHHPVASSESASDSQARRGISDTWKARPEELRRGTAACFPTAVEAHCPPLTCSQALRGRPEMTMRSEPRQPPSHAGANEATSGDSSGDHGEALTLRTARAQLRAVQVSTRRVGTFDPSEFSHAYDLNPWRDSWPRTRHRDPSSDDDELSDEDEEDDEDEQCRRPFPEQESLEEDSSSSLRSEYSTDLVYGSVNSPSSSSTEQPTAALPTPPPTVEEEPMNCPFPTFSRFLEIRGLPKTATVESIFDTVSSFTPVDNVDIFRADDGVGGRITATVGCS